MNQDLIAWKSQAWTQPEMVAWYAGRMADTAAETLIKNAVEVGTFNDWAVGERILDVGVGTGRASLPLARAGRRVTGVDSSQAMLDECRRQAGDTPMELLPGDVLAPPVPDAAYDTVMAMNVLTHFPHWREVLAAWKRKVVPGGRIVFDIYSLDHIRHFRGREVQLSELAQDPMAFNMHVTVEEVVAAADALGLTLLAVQPYGVFDTGEHRHAFLSTRPLPQMHFWRRMLSWARLDPALLEFCVFMEREFIGHLTSRLGHHLVVVLEQRADPAANQAWLARNAALNDLLGQDFTLDALSPWLGDLVDWRRSFSRHLEHPRAAPLFLRLWQSLWPKGNRPDLVSFMPMEQAQRLLDWWRRDLDDYRVSTFLRHWQQHPVWISHLYRTGVNLGVAMEYDMTKAVLENHRGSR